ncbi:MAG: hypothetical protein [Bacteriophage sp.]|nr:MAG: hypothetical protein [Bacteriophage sp.]
MSELLTDYVVLTQIKGFPEGEVSIIINNRLGDLEIIIGACDLNGNITVSSKDVETIQTATSENVYIVPRYVKHERVIRIIFE